MRLSARVIGGLRTATLVVYISATAVVAGVLWINTGGSVPGVTGGRYRITASVADARNLVHDSDVRIAGVGVGKVKGLRHEGGAVRAVLEFSDRVSPLHQGATVRLASKSLLEESYLDVTDGTGPPLPHGSVLPPQAEVASVRLDDVLNALDAPTRASLSSLVQRLGDATAGRGADISGLLAGLGKLGREGHDAVDILASQSDDLKALTAQTAQLLGLLDEGQGRIVHVVDTAERVSRATASQADHLEAAVKALPGVLDRASAASPPLRSVTAALAPLIPPLLSASPDLSASLVALGPVAGKLRASLAPLGVALDRAPATLIRVPPVADDVQALVPTARAAVADLNPMLAYLAPYAPDAAALVANLNDAFNGAENGMHYWRVAAYIHDKTVGEMPVSADPLPTSYTNAYPPPGGSSQPRPFSGEVPHVDQESED